jgi:two-component system osmolarity sensor histidine kinase EnvZ
MVRPEFHLGLFARTFLLLALLMLASLGAWIHVLMTLDSQPQAERTATHLINTATLTRSLLMIPDQHIAQTIEQALHAQNGLDLRSTPPDDVLPELPQTEFWIGLSEQLQRTLGPETQLLRSSRDDSLVWVGIPVEGHTFWLGLDIDRSQPVTGVEWFSWVIAAALLSLVGAAVAVGYMNRPLARLAKAAQQLSRGETPDPLPEQGALEIQELNTSFNRMVSELRQAENDRNLMLAGISHDLRTPLARMRLEIEMSPISEEQRQAIDQDLSQVDRTIGQLLEYARPARKPPETPISLLSVLNDLVDQERGRFAQAGATLTLNAMSDGYCLIDRQDFSRCVINLLENARRYGVVAGQPNVVEVSLKARTERLQIDISDQGPGIDSKDIARVMRPFSRGDTARTGVSGAGLGLSIVERLLSRAGGTFRLLPREGGGLIARMELPRSRRPRHASHDTHPESEHD